MCKAAPEPARTRQREDVEQRRQQPVRRWPKEIFHCVRLIARMAHVFEHLARHRRRNAPPQLRR
jgi:hypothetical protein